MKTFKADRMLAIKCVVACNIIVAEVVVGNSLSKMIAATILPRNLVFMSTLGFVWMSVVSVNSMAVFMDTGVSV